MAGEGGDNLVIHIEAPAISPFGDQPDQETNRRRLELHKAAVKGDWKAAGPIFNDHPTDINAPLTRRKETALHVATLAERTDFVRKLVDRMTEKDLELGDIENRTALCLATLTGKQELAQILIEKNPDLDMIRTIDKILPLHMAVFSGHRKMVEFLYRRRINKLDEKDLQDLLVGLIDSDMFDIALDILAEGEVNLLTLEDRYQEKALTAMARKPHMLSKSRFYGCLCSKDVQKKKARKQLKSFWENLAIMNESQIIKVVGEGWRTIFVAVVNGNVEFLRILIDRYPDLVTKTNEEGHTIFHVAVVHRQAEIFELIHTIGSLKNMIATTVDVKGNHLLHLAAQLAPSHRLQPIPGEPLKLQHELLWFEEVAKVVGPRLAQERNILQVVPQTPREIFIENHKDMIEKAEERVRKIADSCILVAILVATVVFAAAYTVSGGTDQTTGYPIFLHDISFKIFAVADAVSLIFSATSVLTFLSLLTSTYVLEDFVRLIPAKLLLGIATLAISLASMMVAFVTAFFMYFKQHHAYLKYAVPMAVVSFIPPLMFLLFHGQIFSMIRFSPSTPNHRRRT